MWLQRVGDKKLKDAKGPEQLRVYNTGTPDAGCCTGKRTDCSKGISDTCTGFFIAKI